jgi:dienelactone hydrolase
MDEMQTIWDMTKLAAAPKMWGAEEVVKDDGRFFFTESPKRGKRPSGVKAIWYESEKYQKKTTRVFAWLGVPETTGKKKLPAMVLVHGGGGTAFAHWVQMWNQRGYAAIAMDTCGHVPCAPEYGKWDQHEFSGPDMSKVFEGVDLPVKEQWSYHAVAAVIRAHSLLQSLPQVDSKRIGICGISWGGYLTSISMGIDDRFRFAAPIYGCGFLDEQSAWENDFEKLGPKKSRKWLGRWDPSNYIPNAKLPTLWVTGTNDIAYNLWMVNDSYRVHGGKPALSVGVRYGHSHAHGWKREESMAFADSVCMKGEPLVRVVKQGLKDGRAFAAFDKRTEPKGAWLCFTSDDGKWKERYWRTRKVEIGAGVVSADVPAKATACFFNFTDKRGLISSSTLIETTRK